MTQVTIPPKTDLNKPTPKRKRTTPHKKIIKLILSKIKKVDFESIVKKDKIYRKHYIIVVVEHVLEIAKKHNWNLCIKNNCVHLYNSEHWQKLEDKDLKYFLGKAAENMGVDKWDAKYFDFKDILLKQFMESAYLPELESPKNYNLINLKNGTFEITPKGWRLRPFDANDYLTYQLPFNYDENAKCPRFEKYLKQVQPNEQSRMVLAEFLAYIFTKHLKLEKTLLLYGSGANGKSVFFDIVNALLGSENITSYSFKNLTDEHGYYRANLSNSLVNYASEIDGNIETNIFKKLVSGEPYDAQHKYGKPFIVKERTTLIFNCNDLPQKVEHNNAYFRRFLIIPFSVTIEEKKQDKQLATKIIKSELSGVFNWVLEGLQRLLKQKRFTHSTEAEEQLKRYKIESDSVRLFMEEETYFENDKGQNCKAKFLPDSEGRILMKDLYSQYKLFCMDDSLKPVSKKNFRKRLEAMKILVQKINIGNVVRINRFEEIVDESN